MLNEALSQVSSGASSGSGDGSGGSNAMNITKLLMLMEGLWPSNSWFGLGNPTACQVLPYCAPNLGYPLPWMPCQSPDHKDRQIVPGFEFSPPLGKYYFNLANQTDQKTSKKNTWTWFQWVLSNEWGAFTSLGPFAVLQHLSARLLNISATRDPKGVFKNVTINKIMNNFTVPASPVCLKAPFFFLLAIVTNATGDAVSCNTSEATCIESQC